MAQYVYVIDTGITTTSLDGVTYSPPLAVGQTTYDLIVEEKFRHGIIPVENTSGLWKSTEEPFGIYNDGVEQVKVGIGTSEGLQYQLTVLGSGTSTTDFYASGVSTHVGFSTFQNNIFIAGITTSKTYTASGTLSSSDAGTTQTIDAFTTQMYHHEAVLVGDTTFQVSNLTDGKYVYLYIRNASLVTSPTIYVTASETTSGYSSIQMSRSGSSGVTNFSIATSGGVAVVWVANIGGNLVGSLS